jgi:hypothetical protein
LITTISSGTGTLRRARDWQPSGASRPPTSWRCRGTEPWLSPQTDKSGIPPRARSCERSKRRRGNAHPGTWTPSKVHQQYATDTRQSGNSTLRRHFPPVLSGCTALATAIPVTPPCQGGHRAGARRETGVVKQVLRSVRVS